MAAVRGSKLLIKRGDGEVPEEFETVGALQSSTLSLNGNPIDVTTADDVDENGEIWQTQISGLKSLSVSGNGIGKDKQPIQDVYADFATGTITNYEIIIPHLGVFEVPMIVGDMEFSGPHDGVLGFTISLMSAGAPEFTKESG